MNTANRRGTSIGLLGLLSIAGFVAHAAQDGEVHLVGRAKPALPEHLVVEGDERPLHDLRIAALVEALEIEKRVVAQLKASIVTSDDRPNATLVLLDMQRNQLDQFLRETRNAIVLDGPLSDKTVGVFDRYLSGFAYERMLTDSYDLAAMNEWRSANLEFLRTSAPAVREHAEFMRLQTLRSAEKALLLRRIIAAVQRGPLSDAEQQQFLGELKTFYPSEPLPVAAGAAQPIAAAPTDSGPLPEALPLGPTGRALTLPRLDGVERVTRVIAKLPTPLAK
ncbi:MAG: hypothetical protein IPH13_09580 [Planctomycetes bacterium]|nr:hypothetical protein [Planctomycetota bacterium]MCC7170229.1 hypothetical protein [Planctomycetota bacterium]